MKVRVKVYSVLREKLGVSEIDIEVNRPLVSDVLNAIREKVGYLEFDLVVYDSRGVRLSESDSIPSDNTLYVMPPPSGGTRLMVDLVPSDVPSGEVVERVRDFISKSIDDETGAILVFTGIVRGKNKGRRVKALRYEAAEDIALKVFERIAREIMLQNNVKSVCGIHYVGERKPGDLTMILAVTGVSRENVFPALREFLERVKHELPIWKVEVTDEGSVRILNGDKLEFAGKD